MLDATNTLWHAWGMPKRSSRKLQQDFNQLAAAITATATADKPHIQTETLAKNQAAVALGRLGGLRGGNARAAKLSNERKTEIAKKAAEARWKNRK